MQFRADSRPAILVHVHVHVHVHVRVFKRGGEWKRKRAKGCLTILQRWTLVSSLNCLNGVKMSKSLGDSSSLSDCGNIRSMPLGK